MEDLDPYIFYNWYSLRCLKNPKRGRLPQEFAEWKEALQTLHIVLPKTSTQQLGELVLFFDLFSEWVISNLIMRNILPSDKEKVDTISKKMREICHQISNSVINEDEDFILSPLGVVYYKVVNQSKLRDLKINKILK